MDIFCAKTERIPASPESARSAKALSPPDSDFSLLFAAFADAAASNSELSYIFLIEQLDFNKVQFPYSVNQPTTNTHSR